MRLRGRILIAGTIVAAAAATLGGVATSQTLPSAGDPSDVVNVQTLTGDVIAGQTLNVEEASGQTVGVAAASGNTVLASTESGTMNVTSRQTATGQIGSTTTLNSSGQMGAPLSLTTTSVANSGTSSAYGATLNADIQQTTGTAPIYAHTIINGDGATAAGTVAASSTALGNTEAMGVQGSDSNFGYLNSTVVQAQKAGVTATVGGQDMYMPGSSAFTASAVSNSMSSTGTHSAQSHTVDQSATGDTTAYAEMSTGNAQDITETSTANANTVAIDNAGGSLEAGVTQNNNGQVSANTITTAYEFGSGTADAYGVGNSSTAGNNDVVVGFANDQTNTGGVEADATFSGHDGYDAYSNAIAIGNTTTAYACSACGGVLNANSTQTNSGGVSATSTVTVAASSRATTASAIAVGNSATFYVSGGK